MHHDLVWWVGFFVCLGGAAMMFGVGAFFAVITWLIWNSKRRAGKWLDQYFTEAAKKAVGFGGEARP